MKRIYLAGPMSGLPEFNYPAFHAEAARLRALGYHVENPAENPVPACKSWTGYMAICMPQIATCEAVALLPNWETSRGANREYGYAIGRGLRISMAAELVDPA